MDTPPCYLSGSSSGVANCCRVFNVEPTPPPLVPALSPPAAEEAAAVVITVTVDPPTHCHDPPPCKLVISLLLPHCAHVIVVVLFSSSSSISISNGDKGSDPVDAVSTWTALSNHPSTSSSKQVSTSCLLRNYLTSHLISESFQLRFSRSIKDIHSIVGNF